MTKIANLYFNDFFWFTRGYVFSVDYRLKGFGYTFTGICLAVRKKRHISSLTSFLLRNVFSKVAVELSLTLYGACRLTLKLLEHAKKKETYRSSKLYYLRFKDNNDSLIKL